MRRIFEILILLLVPISLAGQLAPVTNQYVLNPLTINPAYAGTRGALNIAAFYRHQWVGITGAPETFTLAADAPFLDSKLGLGMIITTDKIGVTKETHFHTNYAYKIKMGDGILSLGFGAGLIATNTAYSELVVLDPGDELYLANSRVFVVPDFSFGGYYTFKNYYAGISLPKLMGYKFDFGRGKYALNIDPANFLYLVNTGYIFNLSPKFKFFPSTLLQYAEGRKFLYDINAYLGFSDHLWIGTSYRSEGSVAALVQFALNSQLRFAYTYDFDFNKLGHYNNGSHEIMLRYEFRYKVNAINPLNF